MSVRKRIRMSEDMKQLKVWGGRYYPPGEDSSGRMLIAAYTKTQAIKLANISYNEISKYFSETGNKYELGIATEVGVWITTDRWADKPKYKRIK